MTKPVVAFRDFADAPKNVLGILIYAYKVRNPYKVTEHFKSYRTLLVHTSLILYVNNELMRRQTLNILHSLHNCSGYRTACLSTDDEFVSRAAKCPERETDHVSAHSLPLLSSPYTSKCWYFIQSFELGTTTLCYEKD